MSSYLQDPAVLIPVGVILLGTILFIWAAGKLFKKKAPVEEFSLGDPDAAAGGGGQDMFNTPREPEPEPARTTLPDFGTPPIATRPPLDARVPAPAANKEMVDRLDTMAHRLSDMQTALHRQAGATPSGSVLTPETIDKLLKIISNVTQQVDVLQRSLGATPTAPTAAAPAQTPAPAPGPKPASPPATPSSATPPSAGSGKTIGVEGGALSGFGRSKPVPTGQTGAPGGPPTTPPNPANPGK